MDLKLVNRLAMIGIEFIGIGGMLLSPITDQLEIQKKVIMDMGDIIEVEKEVEERKRKNEREFYYNNYKIVIKR